MPTYEYKCKKCGHSFEAFQSITAAPLSKCPECKGAVKRVINGGMGIIFKGSGFYSTDNKKGSVLSGGNGHSTKEKEKTAETTAAKPAETVSSAKPSPTPEHTVAN